MSSTNIDELAREQAYVTVLYERLDALRDATAQRLAAVRLDPTVDNDQARSEREAFAELYQDRSAELDAAERNLCFGRLDFDDGEVLYVGRRARRAAASARCIGAPRRTRRSTGPPRCSATASPGAGPCTR